MDLPFDSPNITSSKAILCKDSNGSSCVVTFTPVSHNRFRQDRDSILRFADLTFGKSNARRDACNRYLNRMHKQGKLDHWRIECFHLPTLPTGQSFSRFVFNENNGKRCELNLSVDVVMGGKHHVIF